MTRLPTVFFATGAIFALLGMLWGIQMSASHDHTLSSAHGHFNPSPLHFVVPMRQHLLSCIRSTNLD